MHFNLRSSDVMLSRDENEECQNGCDMHECQATRCHQMRRPRGFVDENRRGEFCEPAPQLDMRIRSRGGEFLSLFS